MTEEARKVEQPDMLSQIHALIEAHADEILTWPLGTLRIDWSPKGPKASLTKYINRERHGEQLSA